MPFDAESFQPARLLDRDPKTLTDPKERLMYLRDFLRELPAERFRIQGWYSRDGVTVGARSKSRLSEFVSECGTAACICGWAGALFAGESNWDDFSRTEVLGLTVDQADDLYFPPNYRTEPRSNAQAANVLDHLIQTGEVDWSKA